MDATVKRKSPRAPSLPLDEAIARVAKMYKEEGRHPAPVEVAMRHIGYNSKNGAALQAIASLGYWGLIERPRDGLLMVTKAFEDYEFSPDEAHKRELLIGFLRNPPLFAGLLDKYQERLPSDATIRYDLIQKGFIPSSAASCMTVFKRSIEFARYFDRGGSDISGGEVNSAVVTSLVGDLVEAPAAQPTVVTPASVVANVLTEPERQFMSDAASGSTSPADPAVDRIPVRLAGGRRAWLEIPTPFFSTDKKRLKKHIDLLLTDDEDEFEDGANSDE